jgi:hypothetical protein
MSNAQIRADIATALSTVTGPSGPIHGHVSRPAAMNERDAWPQWRGSEYAAGHSFTSTWVVLVVLPQTDDVTADSFADQYGAALLDALRPVLAVDTIAPAEIPTEAGQMYALLITGRAE